MAAGTRKKTPRPPTKSRAAGGGGRPGPKRINRRKRAAISLPWRAGLITILLLLSLGTLAYLVFLHQPAPPTDGTGRELSVVPPALSLPAAPDLASEPTPPPAPAKPREAALPPAPTPTPALPGSDQRPLVAIIIDDMGYRPETERLMLALDLELTFSFLPFSPHLNQSLTTARQQNRDILLHLPLEALDGKWSSTPGMLLTAMGAEEIADGFATALAQVPMAIGLNNHMGSRFTTDPAAMDRLLAQAAHYDLFFLDSLTTPDSVAAAAATRHQVPLLRRDIFLDNDQDEQKIRDQLESLLKIAEKRGYAIGIGHSYPETLQALRSFRPELERRTRPVGLSRLYQLQ
ncbi:divergent polysaccharide deacetylase family protein [Desulfurivibrio sp. D14AmB]|uniref:divergent polysaccharide deacetylase family protein n=1 Tax=Desulfurivibrio sp. D14AmB TaxID=3374370 RepID=UPI00376F0751